MNDHQKDILKLKADIRRLKKVFFNLCEKYTTDEKSINICWNYIINQYNEPDRYYHTMIHLYKSYRFIYKLTNFFSVSIPPKKYDSIIFSIFYHDIIYDPSKKNNEEMSAEIASIHLKAIDVPINQIDWIKDLILATKNHVYNKDESQLEDFEKMLFLDIDMSILGSEKRQYKKYCKRIRLEYSIYCDDIYYPNRKRFLLSLLEKERIYETAIMNRSLEKRAQKNIKEEVKYIDRFLNRSKLDEM